MAGFEISRLNKAPFFT